MGLSSWFRDLGVPWKISIGIVGGVAAVTSAYGLYTFYVYHVEQLKDNKDKSLHDETASETSEKKVLVLGLESAGKTSFLAALAQHDSPTSEREVTTPTEGFHVVCVSTEGVSLNIWEIGGKFQSYWPNFLTDTNVIVYVIDSSDTEQFDKSKNALLEVLSDGKLNGVPVVLLVCKQDLKGAKPLEEIASLFGVEALSSDRQTGIVAIQILANGDVSGLQEAKKLILNFCKQ